MTCPSSWLATIHSSHSLLYLGAILNTGKLQIGQKANLSIEKYPEVEFGKLESVLTSIFAVPDADENYLIEVKLPSKLITAYNIEIPFESDMQVTGEVITEDLRILERIFYRLRGLFD